MVAAAANVVTSAHSLKMKSKIAKPLPPPPPPPCCWRGAAFVVAMMVALPLLDLDSGIRIAVSPLLFPESMLAS